MEKLPKRKKVDNYPKKWGMSLKDVPCFIIGNGPSLEKQLSPNNRSILENLFTIGINRSFYKMDTTILLWQDMSLWYSERKQIAKQKSIKFCRDHADPQKKFFHFKLSGKEPKLVNNPDKLYGRGTSGVLAFELAYSLGCDPIILLGMDCQYNDGKTDFYGKNPMHNEKTLPNCVKGLEWVKNCNSGRKIINCSRNNVFDSENKLDKILVNMNKIYTRKELETKIFKNME